MGHEVTPYAAPLVCGAGATGGTQLDRRLTR